ncbi:MAG: aminotransferase class V-fold PLP-dependent enzyme [Phycisphaerales bacterium]|nr:aminotransferase class V-fold PLP-dependent enzyme [Phycisphaerales bacterium]
MIYLDNNATTRPYPQVLEQMQPFLADAYGNPSSVHRFGQEARQAVEQARYRVANLLHCQPGEVIFTSGGTEADNAAIAGLAAAQPNKKAIITSSVEHSAVREPLARMADCGFNIIEIPVDQKGELDYATLQNALARGDVALAAIMAANNETGVVFDISAVGNLCRNAGVPLHVDAVQMAGKLPIDFAALPVQTLAISAHKFHGPKGVGALVVRRGSRWQSFIRGGPQERDRRGGTENVPGIVGMGAAAELAQHKFQTPAIFTRIATLRNTLETGIINSIAETTINGNTASRIGNTTNIGFAGLEAEAILLLLSQHDVCASAGAACSSGSLEPSHVLRAMKLPDRVAHGSLRFSLSEFTTETEIAETLEILPAIIEQLRKVLPTA